MAHQLPDLPYPYDALEPHIDAQTMEIHHTKHHNTYVTKLNDAIKGTDLENKPLEELLRNIDSVPSDIRTAVRNNGGGHANHSLFWKTLGPKGGGSPSGKLGAAIDQAFGSFSALKDKMNEAGQNRFGSGWAWLSLDGDRLVVEHTPNQDSPLMEGRKPIFGIDVWEHAYYLKYQNRRPDYLQAIWNVVDWSAVERVYESAAK